ncbi:MAG: hypothetical protein ACP5U1_12855 [Desulfomonilaceae bacterium]
MKRVKDKIVRMFNSMRLSETKKPASSLENVDSQIGDGVNGPTSEHEILGPYRPTSAKFSNFDKSMSAAAFAEVGEVDIAEEILHPGAKPHTVLLVIESETPNANAIEYTVNLCRRISAIMDVLITTPRGANSGNVMTAIEAGPYAQKILELTRLLRDKEVDYHLYTLDGDLVEKLGEYVRNHKEITTVVYDSPRAEKTQSSDDTWHQVLDTVCKRFSIPLITVFDKRRVKLAT